MAAASCRRPGLSCYEFVVFQGFRRRFLHPGAAFVKTSEVPTLSRSADAPTKPAVILAPI